MKFQTIYPDQTIQVELSGFGPVSVDDACAMHLNQEDYDELIDRIDIKPTGIVAFHFADNGDAIKIVFQIRDGEQAFHFGQEDDNFNFQDEADAAWMKNRNQ